MTNYAMTYRKTQRALQSFATRWQAYGLQSSLEQKFGQWSSSFAIYSRPWLNLVYQLKRISCLLDSELAGAFPQVEERQPGLAGGGELQAPEEPVVHGREARQEFRRTLVAPNFGRSDSGWPRSQLEVFSSSSPSSQPSAFLRLGLSVSPLPRRLASIEWSQSAKRTLLLISSNCCLLWTVIVLRNLTPFPCFQKMILSNIFNEALINWKVGPSASGFIGSLKDTIVVYGHTFLCVFLPIFLLRPEQEGGYNDCRKVGIQ